MAENFAKLVEHQIMGSKKIQEIKQDKYTKSIMRYIILQLQQKILKEVWGRKYAYRGTQKLHQTSVINRLARKRAE